MHPMLSPRNGETTSSEPLWPAANHMDWLGVMCGRPLRPGGRLLREEPLAVEGELVAAPWDAHMRRFVAAARMELELRIDDLTRSLARWGPSPHPRRSRGTRLLWSQLEACRQCLESLDAWLADPDPAHLQRAVKFHDQDARARRAWLGELKHAAARPPLAS